jgi:hypothetical protein
VYVPADSTDGKVAVTDVGVAVTVSEVPPSVTVGRLDPVHDVTVVVAQSPVPLMPMDVGVPELFDVTSTEVIDGAATAVADKTEATANANP